MENTFRQRVADFWQAFTEKESEIRKMMDDKAESHILLEYVDDILHIAFDEVYFEMGINKEDKYELILTPEGDKVKLLSLYYWQQTAPEGLRDRWNFYSSKPGHANSGYELQMFGTSLLVSDITLYYEVDKEHSKINLQVRCPKLDNLDENQSYSMFFIFLDQFIGELYTMEYIGYIHFTEDEEDIPSVSISDFKRLIEDTIRENEWHRVENPFDLFTGYRLQPKEEGDFGLREDVYIGMTSCSPIINSYYRREKELYETYAGNGIVFGFVFYENVNVPKQEMVPFRAEIEDKIMEQVESQGIAHSIGGATGFHFSYIDFIIFDYDAFIQITKEIIAPYKFEETGFSKFLFGEEPEWFI